MNKAEIIEKLTTDGYFDSKRAAGQAVDAIFGIISDSLKKEGDKISLPGVGVLKVKKCQARKARNPRTGVELMVPERLTIRLHLTKGREFDD